MFKRKIALGVFLAATAYTSFLQADDEFAAQMSNQGSTIPNVPRQQPSTSNPKYNNPNYNNSSSGQSWGSQSDSDSTYSADGNGNVGGGGGYFSAKAMPGAAGSLNWTTNFAQAAAKARKENKYILLFFTGSDWCGWCKKIESEVFADPDFAKVVGNRFVFVEVDFPMNKVQPADLAKQNADLKQQFGISGYPTVVILDPNQNFVAETGYRPGGAKAYASYLNQLTQNSPITY